jgi:hypothetical protein
MTQQEIDRWKEEKRLAYEQVARAKAALVNAEARLQLALDDFCAACDHRHPDGRDAMSGFAYAFCEICSECGG